MYIKLRYKSQFWTNFHEINMVGAGPLMGESYYFGNNQPNKITDMGEMCPQNQFFGSKSDSMGVILKKGPKSCYWCGESHTVRILWFSFFFCPVEGCLPILFSYKYGPSPLFFSDIYVAKTS